MVDFKVKPYSLLNSPPFNTVTVTESGMDSVLVAKVRTCSGGVAPNTPIVNRLPRVSSIGPPATRTRGSWEVDGKDAS